MQLFLRVYGRPPTRLKREGNRSPGPAHLERVGAGVDDRTVAERGGKLDLDAEVGVALTRDCAGDRLDEDHDGDRALALVDDDGTYVAVGRWSAAGAVHLGREDRYAGGIRTRRLLRIDPEARVPPAVRRQFDPAIAPSDRGPSPVAQLQGRRGEERAVILRGSRLPEEDPRAHVYDIYQWVGYLQETLVDALTR